ncbi:hypothetical protein JSQ81_03585 [Sporosarcina sp. Marseille-Q4063]|uniref:hypothetical protein n=1 Tax=Sporosarcina sp. Marseille-Q4063 TaxID=2810514 RepID=UPI001BAE9A91|nr:hypothetical protein [Sporosarcina sp. Marseille-Q4063]QUW22676.1 hypothetical protein JSQ81_03585 [Sporosarcina sp. Marseille-Q4063]
MTPEKLSSFLFLLIFIGSILFGCSIDKSKLVKVKGTDLTYSEYFKAYDYLDERKNVAYYKPFLINEAESSLPDQVKNTMNNLDPNKLPFKVDEAKAFLVTSKDKDGKVQNQIQLSYLSKDEYEQTDHFFIISVTESDENPLELYDKTDEFDTVGNKLKKEDLTENLPIYQQVLSTNGALLYRYYDENEKGVATVGTAANEFYAYYDGHIYHIGYLIDTEKNDEKMQEKMLQLVREYIITSKFPSD